MFKNSMGKQLMQTARVAGILFSVLTAGCSVMQPAPATVSSQGVTAAAVASVVAPAPTVATASVPSAKPTPPVAATAPGVAPTAAVSPETKANAAQTVLPAKQSAPASPAATPQTVAKSAAPVVATTPAKVAVAAPAAPPLDIKSLTARLKDTKAIGVFTKLALKNQVDDLLEQFRAYYQGKIKTSLTDLRRPYEMLMLKVLALLQDSDPPLANAIVASREAIWGLLADPAKFATI